MTENLTLGLEPWRIHKQSGEHWLSSSPSTTHVRMSSPARIRLRWLIDQTTERDGKESGGVLFGHTDDRLIQVYGCSSPGPKAIRRTDYFRPDIDHDMLRVDEMGAVSFQPVGYWHTHPSTWRSPSDDDLDFFARWRATFELDRFLALIAIPSWDRSYWEFEYFVQKPAFTGDVCARTVTA